MFSRAVRRPSPVPLLHGRGAGFVERHPVPGTDLVDIGAGPAGIEIGVRAAGFVGAGAGDDDQRIARRDDPPGANEHPDDPGGIRRGEHVLHLHRLEHHELATGADVDALVRHLDHRARELRAHGFLPRIQLDRGDRDLGLIGLCRRDQFGQSLREKAGGGLA